MKTSTNHFPKIPILILICFLSLSIAGCSDSGNSTGTDPDPDPEPNPGVSFDSGSIAPSGNFSYTFEEEGTVEYYCIPHSPNMQGKVTVSAGADISGSFTITMDNFSYSPASVTVAPGTTIEWVNEDEMVHTVTSGNPSSGNNGGNPY